MHTARRWEIDALRGLMLVLMTITHLPTRFADPLSQPFGYVSAAEGFVLLSAYMVGLVYGRQFHREGRGAVGRALMRRAAKIYLCQALLLLFLFSVIAGLGVLRHQSAVTDMLDFYFEEPLEAFLSGLLLVYTPPLLDILPLYVVFMIVSPLLLLHGSSRGWAVMLGLSLALWVAAQFGLGAWLFAQAAAWTGARLKLHHTGAFGLFSWQLLWVLGLWMGSRHAVGQALSGPLPRWLVVTSVLLAATALAGRHVAGQIPADWPTVAVLLEKWELRPLRVLNLLALVVVVLHYGPAWVRRLRGAPWLERLGAASLPVFCAHLVATLLALSFVGSVTPERPFRIDVLVVALSFALLYAVAGISAALDARSASAGAKKWRPWISRQP